jgi:Ca2+/H+ antiporter, TMEM165/GDT1 family
MDAVTWSIAVPALGAVFFASLVEAVEAFTIVLAAATLRGWRPAASGALVGLGVLAVLVGLLGPLLGHVPLNPLRLAIGVLLLLFGIGWLRKAVLRAAGVIPLHDEEAIFAAATASAAAPGGGRGRAFEWVAGITAFKAVLIEGIEVVFIVIAVGAGRGLLGAAGMGAFAACLVVLAAGLAVRKPLARVPENALKFGVGTMLSAFGVFWTGEGLGIAWPGQDLAIAVFAALFLSTGLATAAVLRRPAIEVLP